MLAKCDSIYTGKALGGKLEKAKYKSRQTAAHPSNWLVVSKLQKLILGMSHRSQLTAFI
jgi:hypothetical protein